MRELERDLPTNSATAPEAARQVLAIVGAGRVGSSIATAAEAAGLTVRLAGRRNAAEACEGADAVLLCVPDEAIAEAAAAIAGAGVAVGFAGHTSGASTLAELKPLGEAGSALFSIHPLQTVPDGDSDLTACPAAIAGSDGAALGFARELAERLGMRPFAVDDDDRAAYHAAAAIASNFLVALRGVGGRAARADRGRGRPRAARAARPAHRRQLVGARRRRAHRSDRPRRRGDGRAASGGASRGRPGAHRPLRGARRAHPRPRRQGAAVNVARDKLELREALAAARRDGRTIGLVPTMGALHDGHLALLTAARERCDVVVMSLFVNPAQFGPGEDLEAYPRDEARDLELAAEAGVDLVFAPSATEVYPSGFSTSVEVGAG